MTMEQIKLLLEILSIVATGLVGFGGILWKLTKYFHKNDARLASLVAIVNKLTAYTEKASHDFITLKATLDAREKDLLRLEGVSDGTRKDLLTVIKDLQTVVGKIDAMWLTMQRIFPDKVPARASDKKG